MWSAIKDYSYNLTRWWNWNTRTTNFYSLKFSSFVGITFPDPILPSTTMVYGCLEGLFPWSWLSCFCTEFMLRIDKYFDLFLNCFSYNTLLEMRRVCTSVDTVRYCVLICIFQSRHMVDMAKEVVELIFCMLFKYSLYLFTLLKTYIGKLRLSCLDKNKVFSCFLTQYIFIWPANTLCFRLCNFPARIYSPNIIHVNCDEFCCKENYLLIFSLSCPKNSLKILFKSICVYSIYEIFLS